MIVALTQNRDRSSTYIGVVIIGKLIVSTNSQRASSFLNREMERNRATRIDDIFSSFCPSDCDTRLVIIGGNRIGNLNGA